MVISNTHLLALASFIFLMGLFFLFGMSLFSSLFFIVAGAMCVLLLWNKKNFNAKLPQGSQAPVAMLALYLIAIVFSLFFTHSIALSTYFIFVQLFVVAVFLFFLMIRESYLPFSLLLQGLTVIPAALSIVSFFCFFVPGLGSLLPPANVLYPTYGHNHLNAILLLLYPVVWLQAVRTRSVYAWSLVGIYTAGFIISFGRTALLLALMQLFGLGVYFSLYAKQKLSIKLFILILAVIMSCLATFTVLVLPATNTIGVLKQSHLCSGQVPQKIQQLICKDMLLENRLQYWRQAVRAFLDYPLTGYGPGTFGLISAKYRQTPQLKTLYAHNGFLEIFSQSGMAAGLAWSAFWSTVIGYGAQTIRRQKDMIIKEQKSALLLGVLGIVLNCFFDYDWQLVPTVTMSIVCAALVFKDTHAGEAKQPHYLIEKVFTSLLFIALTYIVLTLSASALAYFGFVKQSFSINPYSQISRDRFFESPHIPEKDKKWLAQVYRFHTEEYALFDKQTWGKEVAAAMNLLTYDYWQYYDLLIRKEPTESEIKDFRYKTVQQMRLLSADGALEDWRREQMSEYLLRIVERYTTLGMTAQAREVYSASATVWPFTLHKAVPPVSLPHLSQTECTMLQEFVQHTDYFFGQNQKIFAGWYRDCMQFFPQQFMKEDFLSKIHDLDGAMGHDYWRQLSAVFFHEVKTATLSQRPIQAKNSAYRWYTLWQVTEREGWDVSLDTVHQLHDSLTLVGLEQEATVVQERLAH